MKKVVFTHLSINNFCGIKSFDTDLSKKCLIKGKNREGKSTIKNAILWVFTGNLENGKDAGAIIRPQDEDGNAVHFVDISVSVTANIGGDEYVFSKTQREKWTKRRGSDEKVFDGNENIYEISGVPKAQKDFMDLVSELICPVDILPFCINANEFLGLDNKKRREKALSLVDGFSDEKVIENNPGFETLRADLKVGTTDELIKRTKATIKRLKDEQKLYPARIDEVSKSIVQEDFAELELHKNALKEKLTECEAKASEEIALQTTISKLKGELTQIAAKLTGTSDKKKHDLELKTMDIKNEIGVLSAKITAYEGEIEYLEQTIENRQKVIAETEVNLDNATKREIEQISLFCPTCGQLMPTEKQDENKAKLQAQKQAEMNRYSDYLDTLKAELKTSTEKVKAIKEKLPDMVANREQLHNQITELEKEIASASEVVNYESDPEYIAKQKEIETLESQLPAFRDYKSDKFVIKEQLEEVEFRLGKAAANAKAEERIEQLKAEQLICAQNILKQEQILDTIEKFIRVKIGMIEDSVNKYFTMIRFKFYQPLVNGGFAECCKITVQGIDYELSLNKSDRLLCQMDLCKGFMKGIGEIALPLILDDSESIDSDRIPDYEGQMIVLRREDCALTVEKG